MLKAISLYTGVGGLDFGFEVAGFRTAVAIDLDPVACRTIRLNRGWPILEGDIDRIPSDTILDAAGLRPGEADVLIGGPPCQPFSKAAYWANGDARRLDDPRADTLRAYLRVLRDTKPRAFLLENVLGLAYKGKDEGLKHLQLGLAEVNRQAGTHYEIHWTKLNAAGFGVPQIRERVFLIGSRDGRPFDFPAYTHAQAANGKFFENALEPYRTAWDAIGDLPARPNDPALALRGKWADLLPTIPEGQNYLWHTKRGGGQPLFGWRRRFWSFLLKLAKDQPSWTIQAQPSLGTGPFHWANRKLSTQELCRFQTLPESLVFDCAHADVQRLLGNAVPSLLAEVLARAIKAQLLDHGPPKRKPGLLPPVRRPVPAPETLLRLPRKYRIYIGDHPDHPGKGLGAGALRWTKNGHEANQTAQPNSLNGSATAPSLLLDEMR
jgi:DNA (cytosine-5)-methyltransferase 1